MPIAIISIPLIRNTMDIITPSNTSPTLIGWAITRMDTAMLNVPTPKSSALDRPEILPLRPWTILEIPLRNKATAARNIKTPEVNIGNCIRIIEKAIINRPDPIFTSRDRPPGGFAIPMAIRSIPITSNITESIIIITKIAGPMYSKMARDSTTQMPPNTICNIRSHGGVSSVICNTILTGLIIFKSSE